MRRTAAEALGYLFWSSTIHKESGAVVMYLLASIQISVRWAAVRDVLEAVASQLAAMRLQCDKLATSKPNSMVTTTIMAIEGNGHGEEETEVHEDEAISSELQLRDMAEKEMEVLHDYVALTLELSCLEQCQMVAAALLTGNDTGQLWSSSPLQGFIQYALSRTQRSPASVAVYGHLVWLMDGLVGEVDVAKREELRRTLAALIQESAHCFQERLWGSTLAQPPLSLRFGCSFSSIFAFLEICRNKFFHDPRLTWNLSERADAVVGSPRLFQPLVSWYCFTKLSKWASESLDGVGTRSQQLARLASTVLDKEESTTTSPKGLMYVVSSFVHVVHSLLRFGSGSSDGDHKKALGELLQCVLQHVASRGSAAQLDACTATIVHAVASATQSKPLLRPVADLCERFTSTLRALLGSSGSSRSNVNLQLGSLW